MSAETSRTQVLTASPRIFATPALDRFTRVHPAVPLAIFLPAIGGFVALAVQRASTGAVLAEIAGGYVFWTLTEYWLHRAVFHFEPQRGIGARLHWMIHGVHHDHPSDPRRLVMPPMLSVPLASVFVGLFVLVLGSRAAWGMSVGFFFGYLVYDMTHYALHHHHPRNRLGKWLRELHMRHHFEDDERGFGVSVPWWDIVFGTYSTRVRRTS
ncbi:MAG TPA: sterol desaturase family protein [Gaiellaceae bacterium]|nr:sterol desaturase family protein [Gaiellaceae bacterium]